MATWCIVKERTSRDTALQRGLLLTEAEDWISGPTSHLDGPGPRLGVNWRAPPSLLDIPARNPHPAGQEWHKSLVFIGIPGLITWVLLLRNCEDSELFSLFKFHHQIGHCP